jgi:hypothetical protein
VIILDDIIFFDIAAVTAIMVIASLSKSIGEALKIPPYYKLLYCASAVIAAAAIADSLPPALQLTIPSIIPMGLRCLAGAIAMPVCLRYWKWLISEYFKN